MGTYIHRVLLFAWVLLFRKWTATGLMGTYIHRVLVFDGYLYSRVYGIGARALARVYRPLAKGKSLPRGYGYFSHAFVM